MMALASTKFLTDRIAIVTASTKGIGFAIAKRLGLDGASIVVSSRKRQNVDDAIKALRLEGIDADGITAHVGIAEDRKKIVDFTINRFGKLDILVSNAAVSPHYGDLLTITDNQWDKLLKVKSALQLTQLCTPHLEASGRGNIVFVTSIAGYAPIQGLEGYSIMKTALAGMTKALSQSLACKNIRVNSIAPGIIRTDFSSALYSDENKCQILVNNIPLNRLGDPEEVANAAAFLVSDDASYISGESIGINGGLHARI